VNRWKLPEIRRDHLLGRLPVSSPERAPSSSEVTASGVFAVECAMISIYIRGYYSWVP
jgi:hypothetical protein